MQARKRRQEPLRISTLETGTAQGSILSPLLGNLYLHHVLDRWFEREVKPRPCGHSLTIRLFALDGLSFHRPFVSPSNAWVSEKPEMGRKFGSDSNRLPSLLGSPVLLEKELLS